MTAPLQSALRKYQSGDYQGVIRDHGRAASRPVTDQTLEVVIAQSYLKTGDTLNAARHYRRAGDMKGQNNLSYLLIAGNLFFRNSAIADAYAVAGRARSLEPADPKALEFYYRTLRETCLFEEIEAENAALLAGLKRGDPRALMSDGPFSNIAWCDDEAVNANLRVPAVDHPVTEAMRKARRARPHRWGPKLRIGYLSDDYYANHPIMRLFQGVMVRHDAERYDITHFCFTTDANIATDTMRGHYPNLVRIGHMSDEDAAAFIRAREIDVLIDMKGHTNGCRPNLVNLGLAPVQAAWHGFAGSGVGIDCDYVISDRFITPDSSIPHYHEKLCRLPESYQPNDNVFRPLPPAASRADLGLPEDRIVIGFFNATRKLTPHTFDLTMRVLEATGDSVLWILFFNDFARENFLAAATRRGIDPARIIIAPKAHYADHIARVQAVDFALDAFPYNGHTTTSDALWAGVPVPTCKGRHFASRVSESLLTALGVPELIADDADSYVALAARLARDTPMRRALREKIAAHRTTEPLFDSARFARHMERAFEMMVDRARRGLEPDHIDVPALPRDAIARDTTASDGR